MSADNPYVIWHNATVTRERRERQNNHRACVLWFTGLSGSGKSTLAHAAEEALHQLGCRTFVLDGDNVRHGLSSNLGFSEEDRRENIRRIGEAAKLMMEAGIIAMTAFISPFRSDREAVRKLMPHGDFLEIYCSASLEVCEARDVKGLYKKARAGIIKNYTGIDSPYEPPDKPELIIDTGKMTLSDSVAEVLSLMRRRGILTDALDSEAS
ncbi:MAG: adenylyl-sulfate kinase [Gallionellaceae bacterium]|nr:adenylyl-sulfate kinase [Gallionellaceae bacterium]